MNTQEPWPHVISRSTIAGDKIELSIATFIKDPDRLKVAAQKALRAASRAAFEVEAMTDLEVSNAIKELDKDRLETVP